MPRNHTSIESMMANISSRHELNLSKRVHRFGHASAKDMKDIMASRGMDAERVSTVCETVYEACAICTATGRQANKKKVSTTHVNKAFNEEVQVDFVYVRIHGERFEALNIVDLGTRYGERSITIARTTDNIRAFETQWFYIHGATRRISADHEFCLPVLHKYLKAHGIELRARPSRSSSKCGRVERNNGVFKNVVERLQMADRTSS